MTAIPPSVRRAVYERDDWQCKMPVCLHTSRDIDPALAGTGSPWAPTVDHVWQRRYGGGNKAGNLRAAHARCNQEERALLARGPQGGLLRGPMGGLLTAYDGLRQKERDEET